jgi:putative ATP-binding cassette transporter
VALLGLVASASSLMVLLAVNTGALVLEKQDRDQVNWVLAGVFGLAVVSQYLAQRWLITSVADSMERGIHRFRMRLVDGVRHADLAQIERVGRDRLHEGITQTSGALSQNAQLLAVSLGSVVLTLFILGYILFLSVSAFMVILAGALLGGWLYHRIGLALRLSYTVMFDRERRLFAIVQDLLEGFRSVRLCSRRAQALRAEFTAACTNATQSRWEVQVHTSHLVVFGQVAMFFLLALVVFVLPSYVDGLGQDIIRVTSAVVFLIGPLGSTIQASSVLAATQAGVARLIELEETLKAQRDTAVGGRGPAVPRDFELIELRGMTFAYPRAGEEIAFALGPLDLRLRRGEVVFITGGNGSGKTSFLKLITGLYNPSAGELFLDGLPITNDNRQSFRELIGAVWAGQHLSRQLHGLPPVDAVEVQALLKWMEIQGLVALEGRMLNRIELSSGQKKRLQLVLALLQARPVLVLDEWAADQDPHFRQKFYEEMIPQLRDRGLTVLAVTHDERYFYVADRRLHFDQGQVQEVPRHSRAEDGAD